MAEALELTGVLYRVETHIRKKGYDDKDALACRAEQAKPAVDAFFAWVVTHSVSVLTWCRATR